MVVKKETRKGKAVILKKKDAKKTTSQAVKGGRTTEDITSIDEIEKLKSAIIESPKNYNNIVKLLNSLQKIVDDIEIVENSDLLLLSRALLFNISEIFIHFINKRLLKIRKTQTEQEQTVCKWLISKYDTFQQIIFSLWKINKFTENIATLKLDSLEILLKFIKEESKFMGPNNGNEAYFPNLSYRKFLFQLLTNGDIKKISKDNGTIDDYLILEFQDSYFNKFWDLKFYFFNELPQIIEDIKNSSIDHKVAFSKILTLTKQSPMYDIENKESVTEFPTWVSKAPENTIYSINTFRINFEKSWISALNLENLEKHEYNSTLLILHKRIIPFFSDAQKLMDFLTAAYTLGIQNKDIIISILALNGLWELMKSYNLDYPDFYKNLYAILTPDLLHLKEKSRFFRLLDLFMSSTHLSAAIVASFIKRLSRLSLNAPPSGIVSIIPFIYNLIKKNGHSTCMLLIHSTTTAEQDSEYIDTFDENEVDPALTNAIGSSIWELQAMINHYHPNVSALVKIFSQHFNKYSYNMEDFLDWSYNKLIDAETKKKLKGELGLEFEKWNKMYDDDGYMPDYLY
jgi:U3 small nucleolar RNA-associated protein 19